MRKIRKNQELMKVLFMLCVGAVAAAAPHTVKAETVADTAIERYAEDGVMDQDDYEYYYGDDADYEVYERGDGFRFDLDLIYIRIKPVWYTEVKNCLV